MRSTKSICSLAWLPARQLGAGSRSSVCWQVASSDGHFSVQHIHISRDFEICSSKYGSRNYMLDTACYIRYKRRFGSWLYSSVQVIGLHNTGRLFYPSSGVLVASVELTLQAHPCLCVCVTNLATVGGLPVLVPTVVQQWDTSVTIVVQPRRITLVQQWDTSVTTVVKPRRITLVQQWDTSVIIVVQPRRITLVQQWPKCKKNLIYIAATTTTCVLWYEEHV
jgi:hypothetical protein